MRDQIRGLAWVGLAAALALGACARPGASGAGGEDANNWAHYGRTSDETHFSPLTQINERTVGRLGLAWSYDIDATPSVFTAPLEVDGVLYFSTGYSVIHAVDARSGKLLWRYDPQVDKVAGHKLRAGWGARGIAYKDGRIFTGVLDGRLQAIDAKTGKLLWSTMTVGADDARYISGPPWVFKDKVVIGHGGAEYGPVRGYIAAYDINTGKEVWRFYTVPGDPAKGPDGAASDPIMPMITKTWTGQWWKFGGGGNVWHAMAYDPKFNRIYFGTANGEPWNPKIRSPGGGDNLFTASVVALDADTGKYAWHYQENPSDSWDYDSAADLEMADLVIDGKLRPVLMHAPKNGFFYVFDRATGTLISAEKYGKATWADRIDTKTGRPVENPEARYLDGKPAIVFPGPVGAHGVHAMAFSPATGLAYIPVSDVGSVYVDPAGKLEDWEQPPGIAISTGLGAAPPDIKPPPPVSHLLAWDPVRQKPVWSNTFPGVFQGGVLSTAGGLVFQGRGTGEFAAYGASDGRKLWAFDAQVGIQAQPITYSVDGRQYVTVIVGWRGSAPNGDGKVWDYAAQHRRVLTFALDGKASLPPAQAPTPLPVLDDPAFSIDPAKVTAGGALFRAHCFVCHGAGAVAGGAAPDLRKSPVPMAMESFSAVVREGVLQSGGMPRFEEFTTRDLEALQTYIRERARAGKASR